MSAILGNGNIQFGDSTTTSTAVVNYSTVANKKTNLGSFTASPADTLAQLGNYGGFINNVPGGILKTPSDSDRGGYNTWRPYLQLNANAGTLTLSLLNCNCVCNC
jgi:hypothetical protein